MSKPPPEDPDFYAPDHRLTEAYDEATLLTDTGIESLCPSYIELAEEHSRYQDGDLLGQGALKDVYLTFDNRTKRSIAMARLRTDRGPEFYDLFVHEAWLTASLNHPNIIKIHDAGVDAAGRPFFTMDLKGNTCLSDLISTSQPDDRRHLLEVFLRVCDAVAYAHSRGVIHLDLKPENIQTDAFGEVLVCDWGLGKIVGEQEEGESEIPASLRPLDNMTLLGQIKGSPGFMSPEQVVPGSIKDHRSDIFALGCLLHLILTKQAPFTGSPERILDATTRANVVPLRLGYPGHDIPESLDAVVLKATSRSPEDRYDSALALQKEIESFLGGYSTQAEESGFFREVGLFLVRNRIPSAVAFLSLIVLTVVSVLFIQSLQHQQAATSKERVRASLFESDADAIKTQYDSLVEQSTQSSEELAAKLASSANSLKNLGIFERPRQTVREARELTELALALDPNCKQANIERFAFNCVTLNFHDAMAHPPQVDYRFADYIEFAKAFPKFSFSEHSRPSIAQMVGFFQGARKVNPNRGALMERILSYDLACRSDRSAAEPIVTALLEYLNGGAEHLICSYNRQDSTFFLWSDRDARLFIPYGSGSCLLSYLHVRTLTLDISGKFTLTDLEKLPIESLDLRKCEDIRLPSPVSLPLLRRIHIRPGQLDTGTLRRFIQTAERLEIIEEAP